MRWTQADSLYGQNGILVKYYLGLGKKDLKEHKVSGANSVLVCTKPQLKNALKKTHGSSSAFPI